MKEEDTRMDSSESTQRAIFLPKTTNKRLKTSHSFEGTPSPKKFNYNFIPSLEHIARVNVILLAWNHPNIISRIDDLLSSNDRRVIAKVSVHWRLLEVEVIEKIKQLPLPKSVIETVICYADNVGKPIIGWILYYKSMILRRIQGSPPKIKNYLEDLVWTTRGTIDHKKTAQRIMHRDEITDEEKYLVACTFCLKEDIAVFVENRYVKKEYESEKCAQPMPWYWTYHIQGKMDELRRKETQSTSYESIYHCLIDLIIYSGTSISGESDAALMYIWCELTNHEKERLIKPLLELCSPECCCFLLSRCSRYLEQKILKKQSHNILKIFIKNNLWIDDIILMVRHMFQFFNEESYSEIMKLLQHYLQYYRKKLPSCAFMYDKYSEILKEMWKLSPPDYKSDIFERDDHLGAGIVHALAWEFSENVIRSIFFDISPVQRRDVMESTYGMKKCIHFIRTDQKNSFKEFLDLAFTEETERDIFKKKLLKDRSHQIFFTIKKERGWTGLKDFFSWFFKLPHGNDINLWDQFDIFFEKYYDEDAGKNRSKAQFLVYYLCEDYADTLCQGSKSSIKLKGLVNWYLRPNEIHHFKTDAENTCLNLLVHFCLSEKNFTLADNILNLFFLENDLSAVAYKKRIFCSNENEILIIHFLLENDGFKSLEKYINWCFSDTKKKKLDSRLLHPNLLTELLKSNNYRLISEYFSWLNLSNEKVESLKEELMNNVGVCTIARSFIEKEINEFESTLKLRRLIEWIDPSLEVVNMFCETHEVCPSSFYRLLYQCTKTLGF